MKTLTKDTRKTIKEMVFSALDFCGSYRSEVDDFLREEGLDCFVGTESIETIFFNATQEYNAIKV